MKARVGHIGLNLGSEESDRFWKELLTFLEFRLTVDPGHFDATDGHTYFCVTTTAPAYREAGYHRRRTGLSHIALRVAAPELVDEFAREFLSPRALTPLYGGVRDFPEYAPGYRAVFFEDPERVKIEVAFEP